MGIKTRDREPTAVSEKQPTVPEKFFGAGEVMKCRKLGRMTLLEMGCSRRRHKRVQLVSRERELSPASRMTGRFQSIQWEDHSRYSANAPCPTQLPVLCWRWEN